MCNVEGNTLQKLQNIIVGIQVSIEQGLYCLIYSNIFPPFCCRLISTHHSDIVKVRPFLNFP